MRIDLIRHGSTRGNEAHRYIGGSTDEKLSEQGRRALAALPKEEGLNHVYASNLARTVDTARILFPDAGVVPVRDLREMEFGAFEGKTADEMADDEVYRAWVDGGCTSACPDGEDRATFVHRCVDAFLQRVKMEEGFGADRVAFVVHGGTIMALLSALAEPRIAYFDAAVAPGGRWVCRWDGAHLLEPKRIEPAMAGDGGAGACSQ